MSEENIAVSVVIVTRNRAEDLLRCLQSVAKQDYADLEVIVVDNASEDDTAALVQQAHPNVTLLQQTRNTGAPEGRNIGIQHAKGDLMFCMDDDAELIDTQTIQKSVEYFRNAPKLACLCLLVLDQHDNITTKLIPRRDRKRITEDTPAAMFSATGCMLKRSAFIEVGGFWAKLNPYFGEEPELSYRLLDKGYQLLYTPQVRIRHYESPMERPSTRRLYYGVRNTPWLAIRHLPWVSVVSLTTLAWGYFFLIAIKDRHLAAYFRAMCESISQFPAITRIRQPIGKDARKQLWKYSGIIFY